MLRGKSPFQQDIIKLIIDKLLIAIIVLLVGFFCDRFLTRFKEEQTFIFEVNKKKVEKIIQTWESIYEMEDRVNQKILEFNNVFLGDSTQANLIWNISSQKIEIDSLGDAIRPILFKNRIWFNKEDFENILQYFNILVEINNVQGITAIKSKENTLKGKREDVLKIRNRLLGE